jgi:hypothetical protein
MAPVRFDRGLFLPNSGEDMANARKPKKEVAREVPIDMKEILGTKPVPLSPRITIYFPNKDRHDRYVENLEDFIAAAMEFFAEVNLGVTRLATAAGTFVKKKKDRLNKEKWLNEDTVIVYSFVTDMEYFDKVKAGLRRLVHKFGRDSGQKSVLVEFSGSNKSGEYFAEAYLVKKYDKLLQGTTKE